MNIGQQVCDYLKSSPTANVKVKYCGSWRTLFYREDLDLFGMKRPRAKSHGFVFSDFSNIEDARFPGEGKPTSVNLVTKFKKLASKASFSNSFIKDCLNSDETKGLYENNLTTGSGVDGKCITLKTVKRWAWSGTVEAFLNALANNENYSSPRFDFQGYDGTLWVSSKPDGPIAGFSKEFRNCGNGYYYLLINDDTFIGYDVD